MPKNANDTGHGMDSWRIQDLIDLEYFLHGDSFPQVDGSESSPVPSPRDIYLSTLRDVGNGGSRAGRRRLIKGWLIARRTFGGELLPGTVYREISRIGLLLAAILGVMGGAGLATSLLHYSGARPLNVALYLGVGVFAQLLLLMVLAVILCFRAASRSLVPDSVLVKLLGRLLTAIFLKAKGRTLNRVGGRTRGAVAAAAGLFQGRRRIYGSLFFWPVFILLQVFAIFFNGGLLGGTLLKLAGSDVAFGWQSTFQVGPQVVYRIVETLALPWRNLLPPGIAHPSLAQIEGSRIILKEGMWRLATGDLVSWWPFLCLSVFFYGLLPRLLLLIAGVLVKRRLLSRLPLDHSECDRLVRSMVTPVVQTAGSPETSPAAGPAVSEAEPALDASPQTGAGGGIVALVPTDIFDACGGLADAVTARLGMTVTDRKAIGGGIEADRAVLEALGADTAIRVLVVQEAWQPPIREMLSFLKALREHLGAGGLILVGLIGKPGPDTIFTKVSEADFRIWKQGLSVLADPCLSVERLGYDD